MREGELGGGGGVQESAWGAVRLLKDSCSYCVANCHEKPFSGGEKESPRSRFTPASLEEVELSSYDVRSIGAPSSPLD